MGIVNSTINQTKYHKVDDDSEGKSIELTQEAYEDDELESELYQQPGIRSRPTKGDKGLFVPLGARGTGITVAINNYKIDLDVNEGEIRVYSTNTDGDELKASMLLDNDGNVVFNDGEDTAVRFSKLKEAFDQLKSDFDNHVNKWNTFASAYVPGGPTVQGTPPTAANANTTTADIDPAEIEEIKVP
jgi:hypothetical protein